MSSSLNSVVCEEIFDESSHPSIDEIRDYATKIGIDPDGEPQLLPLAAEGLMKALPQGWKPVYDEKRKNYYYYNNANGRTQWEHPVDHVYRDLVRKKRTESQSVSLGEPNEDATYTRDDLPSYEEPPKKPKSPPLTESKLLLRQKSEEKPILNYMNNNKKKIGLSLSVSFDGKPMTDNRITESSPKKEFKLLGDGAMFLKSNLDKKRLSDDKTSDLDKKKTIEDLHKKIAEDSTRKTNEDFGRKINEDFARKTNDDFSGKAKGESVRKTNEDFDRKINEDFGRKSNEDFARKSNEDFGRKSNEDFGRKSNEDLVKKKTVEDKKTKEFDRKTNEDRDKKKFNMDFDKPIDERFDKQPNEDFDKEPNEDFDDNVDKSFHKTKEDLDKKTNEDLVEQPRGILRERNIIDSSTSSMKEDDVKNVRFNIEDEHRLDKTKLRFSSLLLQNDNLKLIKPNPLDFLKPKMNESGLMSGLSDSEDDEQSIEKQINVKLKEDNITLFNQLKQNADRELEDMKKMIWNEKNEEILKYKETLNESQADELERILSTEKLKYEENIRCELETLRVEMESRNLGALEQARLRLEADLEKSKIDLQNEYELKKVQLRSDLENDSKLSELKQRKDFKVKLEDLEIELHRNLEKRKDELIVTHNALLDQVKKKHEAILDEIKRDYKSEEKILRKEHENQLIELKRKVTGSIDNEMNHIIIKDTNEERLYEKVRCEKRLLEDKYRCLKEKYLRLKTDVKLSIEKRNRKREQSATTTTTTTTTTGSETERSNSINIERSPQHRSSPNHKNVAEKPPINKTDMNCNRSMKKPEHKSARNVIIQDFDTSQSDKNEEKNDSSEDNAHAIGGRSRKKIFSKIKNAVPSGSTTRLSSTKLKKLQQQRSCSPVENLRRQLQKLEDLEDQFPVQNAAQGDTYHLRYPFTDGQKYEGSSELEFFRHRIHLERDSIKRAKESLRTQKCLFQQRQNDLKLKHGSMARHTLQQLCQEEKDLTDMEVSLHRTRSLLGEKVIRLRHLEQSLQRAQAASNEQNPKLEEATLSDLSSHSASSGISSTEFATAADGAAKVILRGEHLQESSEIIQSLENLNFEIREIWEVLNQQQKAGNMTASVMPIPLVYPDLGWPVLAGTGTVPAPPSIPTLADRLHNYRQHVALANAQSTVVTHAANQGATTTLVERTRNLRHWLRQAGIDPNIDGVAPQATL